ncbi:hypothetical protein CcaverHIS002_0110210 [Cutaneotrichosporon cavernicola]|nr:hypothetical protein CcaverHIS002_0110210 [Cutaneotrichosporon cavernicola]
MAPIPAPVEVEQVAVAPGDFMGFGGTTGGGGSRAQGETPLAHTLVAGDEGMEYLVGGTRKEFDVCVYPLKSKILPRDIGGARALGEYGALYDVPVAVAAEKPK